MITESPPKLLSVEHFSLLIQSLRKSGYSVFGPVVQNHAIVYDEIQSIDDLPQGVEDEHNPGHYRIHQQNHKRYFSYVPGPDTWKRFLFPKEEILYQSTQQDGQIIFKTNQEKKQMRAFLGIRGCEISAIGVQDRVFIEGDYPDQGYAIRRDGLCFIAINCTRSAATCFCSSLGTGPKVKAGYDLALTEVDEAGEHYFILEVGSPLGEELITDLKFADASPDQLSIAGRAVDKAAHQIRSVETKDLKENIYAALENESFWKDLENRCLSCSNCTMVCPTCFCSSVEERTSLDGEFHERVKYWDSCFGLSHSHLAGGSVRESVGAKYRQWFSHKFASWQDQFDTLGCTGCGRCITWCPVGIDVTEEVKRLSLMQGDKS